MDLGPQREDIKVLMIFDDSIPLELGDKLTITLLIPQGKDERCARTEPPISMWTTWYCKYYLRPKFI